MNRNAARHLALVVSILLCFFVYMGYRYWGRNDSQPEEGDIAAPSDIASASGLRPDNDIAAPGAFSLAPPPGGGDSSSLNGGAPSDVSYPIGSIDEQLSSAPSGLPLPPSGSIEESGAGQGEITGLIPSPSLTPPGSGAAGSAPLMPPPAGSLKPPGESMGSDAGIPPPSLPPPPSPTAGTGGAPAGGRTGAGSATPPAATPIRPPAASETTPVQPPARGTGVAAPAPARQGNVSPVTPPASRPPVPAGPAATPSGNMPVSDSLRIYVVQPGDTLSRIAARELGSIALADNIFLLNRDVISDPDHLMAGVRIRLPIRETLTGIAGGQQPQVEQRVVHRVQRGDTLSSIAARYYGSSAAWQFLHQANVSVVPNPNQLSVGMELIIPPYEEIR